MVTVSKLQTDRPAAIRHPLHGRAGGIPVVEIADEADLAGSRRVAEEIHMMLRPACGVERIRKSPGGVSFGRALARW